MPCVLVTGGTGLLGGAVLDALADDPGLAVVSLSRHGARGWSAGVAHGGRAASGLLSGGRHVVGASASVRAEHVQGDVTHPRLGLADAAYEALAARVDVVLHAAGVTDYTTPRAATEAVNVAGTRHVARFAERAHAPLYHVSSGYVRAQGSAVRGRFGAQVYLDSKRAAEGAAGDCATLAAIVRPSILFGHSVDGSSPSFQGLHRLVGMVLEAQLPLLPFGLETRVDFLPRDVVGRALARCVRERCEGELWLTAGAAAPTFGRVVELLVELAAARGRAVEPPRFVSREMVERLVKPAGGPALARRVDLLLALTSHFGAEPLPSSLPLGGAQELEEALRRGASWWAQRSGWPAPSAAEAAQVEAVAS